jgi:hypothetical protein
METDMADDAGDRQGAIWPLPKFYFSVRMGDNEDAGNPAPRIKIHAEIGNDSGSVVLRGILPETGELLLLP